MNYYSILKVNNNANVTSIKKAFKRELQHHHLDVQDTQHVYNSHTPLHIINTYTVLVNPMMKQHYDEH